MSPPARGVAVVSGGGSGIGRVVALELGRRGHPLALLGRRREPLEETLAMAGGAGASRDDGLALACDVRDAAAIERAAAEIHARYEAAEVVVPAAGVVFIRPLVETSLAELQETLATNLGGVFLLLRALLPAMVERGRGHLFPLLSVAARRGFPGWSAYCASKWGLAGLVASLREELQGSGLRVTAVYPGATDTPLWDGQPGEWKRESMVRPEEVARAIGFALDGDAGSVIEEIHLGPAGGAL
ncbi:MAG TPA: SDR family oxidoreductase [Thermoanaerobaculia bacterium]